jgi:hypothetical protein
MGLPLQPLTTNDIGQAAYKEDYRQGQKEEIEHVKSLPTHMVFDTAL